MTAVRKSNDQIAGNLDTGFLKILALIFMLIDHTGVVFFGNLREMRILGRIAFPLYAWCLVVGSVKTKNPVKYGLRLLLLGVLSQPLYMMAMNHDWRYLNILFTLFVALVAIQGIRLHILGSEVWVPALCYLLLGFVQVDYGWKGLTFILLLYLARESKGGLFATFLAYALFWGTTSTPVTRIMGYPLSFLNWPGIGPAISGFFKLQSMAWLAIPLIVFNTKTHLKLPKWLGYAAYPMHLLVLIGIMLLKGRTLASFFNVF